METSILTADKDPMGTAIADYFNHHKADRLRVFSSQFDEDEIPVGQLFRNIKTMPMLERTALQLATGKILDVGAGSGCHALALQEMDKEVCAIDISPLSVEGIIGRLENMPAFFKKMKQLLRPGGCILMDSSDLRYLFEDGDGSFEIDLAGDYYGEIDFQMQYKEIKGTPFDWLYVDFQTLSLYAAECGFNAEIIKKGKHYDYLAKLF